MKFEDAAFYGSRYPEDEEEDDSSWDPPESEYTTRKEMEAEE